MKIKLSVLLQFIEREKDNISKLDSKQLPDVIIELQLEQYHKQRADLTSPREVAEIDEEVIERVFSCWSFDEKFESWMEEMKINNGI